MQIYLFNKGLIFNLYELSKVVKFIEMERKLGLGLGWRDRGKREVLMGREFKIWKISSEYLFHNNVNILGTTKTVHLKMVKW